MPQQVSLFGFDNEAVLDYLSPSLSSVQLPAHAFVTHAMTLLLDKLTSTETPKQDDSEFIGELVVRGSVAAL